MIGFSSDNCYTVASTINGVAGKFSEIIPFLLA